MKPASVWRRVVTVDDETLAARCAKGRVVVIDDDAELLMALSEMLELEGYACETYGSASDYLNVLSYHRPCFPGPSCVLSDVRMPEMDGLELQYRLSLMGDTPILLMSGESTLHEAVSAFRQGAMNFLIKPVTPESLLDAVHKALVLSAQQQGTRERQSKLVAAIAALTDKERQIARAVAAGETNGAIAVSMGVSERSIKRHRQSIFEKLGAQSTAEFVRLAVEGGL